MSDYTGGEYGCDRERCDCLPEPMDGMGYYISATIPFYTGSTPLPVSEKATSGSAMDHQVGGDHYKDFEIQPSEFIHRNSIGFIAGNVIKYVCRYRTKEGLKDLEKARHYIDMLIEMEYGK